MPRLAPVIKTVLFATFISFSFGQPAVARLSSSAVSFGREAYLVTRRRTVELQVWRDFDRLADHRRSGSRSRPPPGYGGAIGAATARAAGSSLSPRKRGSAHWGNRPGRCSGRGPRRNRCSGNGLGVHRRSSLTGAPIADAPDW